MRVSCITILRCTDLLTGDQYVCYGIEELRKLLMDLHVYMWCRITSKLLCSRHEVCWCNPLGTPQVLITLMQRPSESLVRAAELGRQLGKASRDVALSKMDYHEHAKGRYNVHANRVNPTLDYTEINRKGYQSKCNRWKLHGLSDNERQSIAVARAVASGPASRSRANCTRNERWSREGMSVAEITARSHH